MIIPTWGPCLHKLFLYTYTFGRQELVQVVIIEKSLIYLPPNTFRNAFTEGAGWEGVSVQSYEVI